MFYPQYVQTHTASQNFPFQTTYEELKQYEIEEIENESYSFQTTYEELKQ